MYRLSHFKEHLKSRRTSSVVVIAIIVVIVVTLVSSQLGSALLQVVKHILQPFGIGAPIIFILIYIILGLVGFSTSVLSLSAVLLFNPLIAFICIMIGATLSALFAFIIARSSKIRLAFPAVTGLSSRRSVIYVSKQIDRQSTVHGFKLVFLLRLMRLPYIALSYAAGFSARITTRNFTAATLLSNAISATILVVVGVVAVVYFAFATALIIGGGAIYQLWKRYHPTR